MAKDASATTPPRAVSLTDYQPPRWLAERVDLVFDLHESHADVLATIAWRRNEARRDAGSTLELDGEALETVAVEIAAGHGASDGDTAGHADAAFSPAQYEVDGARMALQPPAGDRIRTRIRTRIEPQNNRTMEGLYRSGGMFCTQMEAEGFRRVTWMADRPDVLAVWTVAIEAASDRFPVLLCNGNLVHAGPATSAGRHVTVWHDPFPKPAYLFALVAGDLDVTDDEFTTCSGRTVRLRLYTDKGNADQSAHALAALKKSMRWDEEVYGREYDLDVFHIVAVHDFNMGAMENKSLNIFNASAVLAKAETATDDRFSRIEAIVAHEYFHNWSGNRVTCRDWFQLSLKEGFTVYRDQEFSADVGDRGVARIAQVRHLRQTQFLEDGGPMAHPVRPDSYIEINNFYTTTIYEKGAELIRMMATLIGAEAFRRGTDLYFARHDGQAVTCDDFVAALQDASGYDLRPFQRWYVQAGTPRVTARGSYDAAQRSYTLSLSQRTPPTPGQPIKLPFVIPVRMGLLSRAGSPLPLRLRGAPGAEVGAPHERVLVLDSAEAHFVFDDLDAEPVPVLLRGFSAPVKLDDGLDAAALQLLSVNERDPFARFDAFQRLATAEILHLIGDARTPTGEHRQVRRAFLDAFAALIGDESAGAAFRAEAARLPDEATLAEELEVVDVEAIHRAREAVRATIGAALRPLLEDLYGSHAAATAARPFTYCAEDAGHRALKNVCLAYLCAAGDLRRATAQYEAADNMTDELSALSLLADVEHPGRAAALDRFAARWHADPLVMNAWFSVQAGAGKDGVAQDVERLTGSPHFDAANPNKIRALFSSFVMNPRHFHAADGSGYGLIAARVLQIDAANPILAGRLARAFNTWRRQEPGRRAKAEAALRAMRGAPGLSPNTFEVLEKMLG